MEFTKDIHFSNVLTGNKTSEITYSGKLYQNQSETVSIVYGFGENWDYTTEQEMVKVENGFTAQVAMKENYNTFNFCFKNGNNEWDNNEYANYISNIEVATVEVENAETQACAETQDGFDSEFILELLDSLLEENFSKMDSVSIENTNSKQQILDEILSENTEHVNAPILAEEFDMDELIETILQPVVNSQIQEEEEFEDIVTFKDTNIALLQELNRDLEKSLAELNNISNASVVSETVKEAEVKEETALTTTEESYLVSPRKLRKFYMLVKKIKLAFYKLFVSIPKLLSGNFEENKD